MHCIMIEMIRTHRNKQLPVNVTPCTPPGSARSRADTHKGFDAGLRGALTTAYLSLLCFWCRVGSVCRLWNAAASSPFLWCRVTVGHCWVAPGRKQLPQTELRIKDTLDWLSQNRFVSW